MAPAASIALALASAVAVVAVVPVATAGAVSDEDDRTCLLASRPRRAAPRAAVADEEEPPAGAPAGAQALQGKEEEPPSPKPVTPASVSGLKVRVAEVGEVPDYGPLIGPNRPPIPYDKQSPVAFGPRALLIPDSLHGVIKMDYDRTTGAVTGATPMLLLKEGLPNGVELAPLHPLPNIAVRRGGRTPCKVYVVLSTVTAPEGIPVKDLPAPTPGVGTTGTADFPIADIYNLTSPIPCWRGFLTLFEYRVSKNGDKLIDPKPIVAFGQQQLPFAGSGGVVAHSATALHVLDDGRLLYATGDGTMLGVDGDVAPQDKDKQPGKIYIVDPRPMLLGKRATVKLAALGLRNVQHFDLSAEGVLGFADIGGFVAEEVNFVDLKTLLDTKSVENFGWGRNPDGKAREGTLYINPGKMWGWTTALVNSSADVPEPGFRQPHIQYKAPVDRINGVRADPNGGFAVSGPVTSKTSFRTIAALCGDLATGRAYATEARDLDKPAAEAKQVLLVDGDGKPLAAAGNYEAGSSFRLLNGGDRVDPRFFQFPDGQAGVLLEATGKIYKLEQVCH